MNFDNSYERISNYILKPTSPSLHTIIELSKSHFSRYRKNLIVLSELSVEKIDSKSKNVENRLCSYRNVQFGENVVTTNKKVNDRRIMTVQIERMKNTQVIFVVKLEEVKNLFKDRLIVIPSQPLPAKGNKNRWRHGSGYIMICRALIDFKKQGKEREWNEDDYNLLRLVKNSIVGNKNTPHFGAAGKYYSFGTNALYKIDENKSSIGIYGNNKSQYEEKNKQIQIQSKWVEEKLKTSLESAVDSQSNLFLHCSNFLSPVMDVAEKMQEEHGDINLNFDKFGDIGLYAAQVCVNATTRDYHTEFDQGPTLIYVPAQKKTVRNQYKFSFRINEKLEIQLKMIEHLSFIFSAALLTHRQECDGNEDHIFFNLASFCNKKLFSHMKKSFDRVINEK